MRFEEQPSGDALILKILGEVQVPGLQTFWSRLDELAGQEHRFVVLDLRAVSRVDPRGWLRFIESRNKMQVYGGELALCLGAGAIAETFQVAHLGRLITAHPTLDAALDSISPQRREVIAIAGAIEEILFGTVVVSETDGEPENADPRIARTAAAAERILAGEGSPAPDPGGRSIGRSLKRLLSAESGRVRRLLQKK